MSQFYDTEGEERSQRYLALSSYKLSFFFNVSSFWTRKDIYEKISLINFNFLSGSYRD